MNGVHDMGGMHGFGPIPIEEDEPVFHHEWEGRVYGMRPPLPIPGGFRYAVERLDPGLYLTSSYYERWLHAKIQGLIEAGAFTRAEFDEQLAYFHDNPQATPPRREDPEGVERAIAGIHATETNRREIDVEVAFRPGDDVLTRNTHPTGHTRLPRYARGKRGQVVHYYGVQLFDDATSAGRPDEAEALYSVRFEGQELWGHSAEPNCAVYLDMWQSYLETS